MYSRYPHGILVITRHQRVHNAEDYIGHEVGRQSLHSNFRHLPLLTFGRPEEGPVVGIQIVSDCHTLQVIHPSRYSTFIYQLIMYHTRPRARTSQTSDRFVLSVRMQSNPSNFLFL